MILIANVYQAMELTAPSLCPRQGFTGGDSDYLRTGSDAMSDLTR